MFPHGDMHIRDLTDERVETRLAVSKRLHLFPISQPFLIVSLFNNAKLPISLELQFEWVLFLI